MKKVFFILGSMRRGGAERVVSILADHYAAKGWDVSVFMLLNGECGYPLNPSVKLIDLSGSGSRIGRVPVWIWGLRKHMRIEKPNVVLSFVARINILVLLAAKGLRQRVIVSERNDPVKDGRSGLVRLAVNLLYPEASGIVFQTERAKRYFKKQIADKGIIIGNPIRVSEYAAEKKENKIVSAGRLMTQKNYRMLINAFAKVHMDFPDCKLFIYGEGNLRGELEQQIENCGLTEYVVLPGNVPDVHAHIADAKLFVLSSHYEGLSNALLEAMTMGLPVISTDCAGSDEVIRNGENGLLVPVGDEDAMTAAIKKLLCDGELRRRLSSNAAESAKKFNADEILEKWSKALES